MSEAAWQPVAAELTFWREAGRAARVWLRDDDAIEPTPALWRLLQAAEAAGAPLLLAIIPMHATPALAAMLVDNPLLVPAMHGAWHRNHAPAGHKKEEMTTERGQATIYGELSAARTRLVSLFGPDAGRCYVPPWNRISPEIAALLPDIGFDSVSTYGPKTLLASAKLRQINTHVDLMDWHGGRVGHPPAQIAVLLAAALARARQGGFGPVGVLAHHLVHDDVAWETLAGLIAFLRGRTDIGWIAPPL
ncbi:MAG: polysaccharide deacetylase family protein [Beijerinckiaceae bacterium]